METIIALLITISINFSEKDIVVMDDIGCRSAIEKTSENGGGSGIGTPAKDKVH